ncbi:hypothetical protein [Moorena sp. SIO4A5]|uniref:hypothetical protein n=1 Tax=Moorena sp. SIO4A5 TaxID=2607838 RepID=UPI0013CBA0C0|nr:hypothetical protein [Moorena sp. SIO4A5]NEO24077.1 hypothetical protein [Moorena sp. SIO4A5]
MPKTPQEEFIEKLQKLIKKFPQYAEILELLIEKIQQGDEAKLQVMLQKLKNGKGW